MCKFATYYIFKAQNIIMDIWDVLSDIAISSLAWNGLHCCTVFITNNAIIFPIKIVNLKESPAYAFYSEAFRVQTMWASISGS